MLNNVLNRIIILCSLLYIVVLKYHKEFRPNGTYAKVEDKPKFRMHLGFILETQWLNFYFYFSLAPLSPG